MGMLVDGVWKDVWYNTKESKGRFKRSESQFRNWVTADGRAGPSGSDGFAAESGRYHLYISYACPWAHRTLIFRNLKDLEPHVSLSVVDYFMGDQGWEFHERQGGTLETVNGVDRLWQVYTTADPALYRSGNGAGPVGQAARHHRLQRILRDHPHVQQRIQRARRRTR